MIKILALDFDGVICNGLLEYFESSRRTYNQIWHQEPLTNNNNVAELFYKLRPVIETGWEMPILLRALRLNYPAEEIFKQWDKVCQEIVNREQLNPSIIGKQLDTVRTKWIEEDLENWLSLHTFYEGVISSLKQLINSGILVYIITTKEGIFTRQLLEQQEIKLPTDAIIGKEQKRPKYETLRQIILKHNIKPREIYFVEDRLPALELVRQQPDLNEVGLFLAEWGYNTEETRNSLKHNFGIKLLSLTQFSQDISPWNC
jgi:phosphoglycolate phosphatase-like HAD superfamily hydrolase